MGVSLDHCLRLPTTKSLEFVGRSTRFPVPGSEGMPQVVPAEILDPGVLQLVVVLLSLALVRGAVLCVNGFSSPLIGANLTQ
jgi:hypothetical protein